MSLEVEKIWTQTGAEWRQRGAWRQPAKERGRHQPCWHLDLGLPASRTVRRHTSVVESSTVCGTLLWSLELTHYFSVLWFSLGLCDSWILSASFWVSLCNILWCHISVSLSFCYLSLLVYQYSLSVSISPPPLSLVSLITVFLGLNMITPVKCLEQCWSCRNYSKKLIILFFLSLFFPSSCFPFHSFSLTP